MNETFITPNGKEYVWNEAAQSYKRKGFYSQHGEDRWIAHHIALPKSGTMVEVGVGRCEENSNSLYFENLGWDVILVEPNPALHDELTKNRIGRLFPYAAGDHNGTIKFTQENEPTISGVLRSPDGYNCRQIEVPIRTLASILEQAGVGHVDVLSIDTEGTEMDVWRGTNYLRHNPTVVIVEWSTIGLPEEPMKIVRQFLMDGYALVHMTSGNLIFQRNDCRLERE